MSLKTQSAQERAEKLARKQARDERRARKRARQEAKMTHENDSHPDNNTHCDNIHHDTHHDTHHDNTHHDEVKNDKGKSDEVKNDEKQAKKSKIVDVEVEVDCPLPITSPLSVEKGTSPDDLSSSFQQVLDLINAAENPTPFSQAVRVASAVFFTDERCSNGDIVRAPLSFDVFCLKFVTKEELNWFGEKHIVEKWLRWLRYDDTIDPSKKFLREFCDNFAQVKQQLE